MTRNDDRVLLRALRRYAEIRGLAIRTHSHDWIVELTTPAGPHFVWGYDLGVNSATTARLITDKAATAEVLTAHDVPAVAHRLFLDPHRQPFIGEDGTWQRILDCHAAHDGDSVVKANEGTSGVDVHRVRSLDALEAAVHAVFARGQNVAIAPFLDISAEVRAYVASGHPVLMYRKDRPSVVGDGGRTVAKLCLAQADEPGVRAALAAGLRTVDPAYVPAAGETVALTWKHNLGLGSRLTRLHPDAQPQLAALAQAAARAVGARLVAVDVVEHDGRWQVLEMNNGAMFESAVGAGDLSFEAVCTVYRDALDRALGLGPTGGGADPR